MIIAKIIGQRIKSMLGERTFEEVFGFFPGTQIHDAMDIVHECIHSTKTRNLKVVVIKIGIIKNMIR